MAKTVAFSDETIQQAAEILRAGGLVVVPLSTVYVIIADATNDEAVKLVYKIKDRPRVNPFMALSHSLEAVKELTTFNQVAETLALHFWPGPLTLSLWLKPGHRISARALVRTGDHIALCVPDAPELRQVLAALGRPVICSSANPSGHVTPTRPEDIAEEILDQVELLFDGGPVSIGVETTIVATQPSKPILVRPGAVPREAIEKVLGRPLQRALESKGIQDYMQKHHLSSCLLLPKYNVGVPLRIDATNVQEGEMLLGFGPTPAADLNLSESGDLQEAARNLYAHLAELSRRRPAQIAVSPIPNQGMGETINHRLRLSARASELIL